MARASLQVAQKRVEILGKATPAFWEILAEEALAFVVRLQREFEGRRRALLAKRAERQAEIDTGRMPDFRLPLRQVRKGR